MSFSRAFVLALVVTLVAPQALAQDDLIVPLPSPPTKSKSKAGKQRVSKSKSKPKKGVAKKPEPSAEEDLIVPIPAPTKKPATAKKPTPTPVEDDLIVPIGGKGELLVKLGGGVKGARLLVDNKDMGALPLTAPLELDVGEHTVVVRRPGFNDFSRRITTQAGKPLEVPVTLEAVAGVVTVTADVAGAEVTINGQPKGQVPLNNLVLKPGSYDIVVRKEGFQPETKNVAVRAGKDYTVAASLRPAEPTQPVAMASPDAPKQPNLKPPPPAVTPNPAIALTQEEPEVRESPPLYKRWYVWAGVGLVAAAATGALVASQSGSTRPLSPGDVCGAPGCDATINDPTLAPVSGIARF